MAYFLWIEPYDTLHVSTKSKRESDYIFVMKFLGDIVVCQL